MNVLDLKGVMTKEAVLEKAHDYETTEPVNVEVGQSVEFILPNPESNNVTLRHNRGHTSLSPIALGRLVAHTGMPRAYLSKIPEAQYASLVLPHLNYFYQNVFSGNMIRLLTVNNHALAAIPKADFEHVKVSRVLEAAERQLGDEIAGYHKMRISEEKFRISVLTHREVDVPNKGNKDPFNMGIRIEHDVAGSTSTKVSPYLFRQWCSNGATSEENLDTWNRRRGEEDMDVWLQKSIMAANKCFDKEIERIKGLQNIPTNENTGAILDSVLDQSSVPAKLRAEISSRLLDDGAENLYDIYNVLTDIDSHSEFFDTHPGVGSLNQLAGHLTHHSKLCPTCHKIQK